MVLRLAVPARGSWTAVRSRGILDGMRRLSIATVIAVLLGLLALAPAGAESFRGTDPADDVWRLTKSGDGDDYTASPTRANPDLTRAVVRHGRTNLVIVAHFDDIFVPPGPGSRLSVFGDIRSDQRGASFDLQATQRLRQGKLSIWRTGKRCGGASWIDYDRDVVRLFLPRTCLGDPKWVRVHLTAWSVDRTYVWEDNGFQPGFLRARWTPRLRVG